MSFFQSLGMVGLHQRRASVDMLTKRVLVKTEYSRNQRSALRKDEKPSRLGAEQVA